MGRPDTPPYFRISPRIWLDERFRNWPQEVQFLFIYLLTTLHRTLEGIFVMPVEYIVADLQWTRKKVTDALDILITSGRIAFDPETNVLLIKNALKYQFPENPNQIRGAIRRIKDLPSTRLLCEFQELVRRYCYRKGAGSEVQGFPYLLDQALSERLAQPLGRSLTLSPPQAQAQTQAQAPSPTRRNGVEEGTLSFSLSSEEAEEIQKERGVLKRYPHLADVAQ